MRNVIFWQYQLLEICGSVDTKVIRYDPAHSCSNSGMKFPLSHGIYRQSYNNSLRSSLCGSDDRKMRWNKSFILQSSLSGATSRGFERIYLVSAGIKWNLNILSNACIWKQIIYLDFGCPVFRYVFTHLESQWTVVGSARGREYLL